MRLYLDEDLESRALVRALEKAGHDVQIPLSLQLTGESDTVQLTYAIRESRVCVTGNYEHFEELHDLVLQCGGSHPGIFTIRKDNDRRRDMKPNAIVRAIANVEAFLQTTQSGMYCLNEWQ
jgi:predicted nuclease of predicted toxin-antitoxin system